jgi:cyclin-dependent kinase 8/11
VNAGASMMNYIEKEEIGQGAFGVVYKAFEEKNPAKFVAIKRMKSVRLGMGIPQDAYREMKILREISKIVKDGLSTPEKQGANHIVKLERVYMSHDANSNAMLNLVYNYAEHDLAEIIRYHRLKQVRISNRMIKSIMFQLLKGLDFLHRNWIMHRDISKILSFFNHLNAKMFD